MKKNVLAAAIVGMCVVVGASAPSLAQDNPKPQLSLSGTYQVKNVTPSDDGTTNLDFSATISNDGPNDVSGQLLLRDYSNNETVWARFGSQTIASGDHVKVSANVTMPSSVFKAWSGATTPPVFI